MNLLPQEVICDHILSYCTPLDVLHFGQTSHSSLRIASDNRLWQRLFRDKWPLTYQMIQSKVTNWQYAYRSEILQQRYFSKQPTQKISYLVEYGTLFFSKHGNQQPVLYDNGFRQQYKRTDLPSLPHARLVFSSFNGEKREVSLKRFPQVRSADISQIYLAIPSIGLGLSNGAVYLFNDQGDLLQRYSEHQRAITDLCIHQDLLISASKDGKIKIWKKSQSQSIETLTDHFAAVTSLALLPHTLISGSMDKTVKIWSLTNKSKLKATLTHLAEISCVQSLDSHLFASANLEGIISIHDGERLNCIQNFQIEGSPERKHVQAISWNTHTLLTLSADKTVNIWDYNRGKCINTISIKDDIDPSGFYLLKDQLLMRYRYHDLKQIDWQPSKIEICHAKLKAGWSKVTKFLEERIIKR
jgi:hypothetical protein